MQSLSAKACRLSITGQNLRHHGMQATSLPPATSRGVGQHPYAVIQGSVLLVPTIWPATLENGVGMQKGQINILWVAHGESPPICLPTVTRLRPSTVPPTMASGW